MFAQTGTHTSMAECQLADRDACASKPVVAPTAQLSRKQQFLTCILMLPALLPVIVWFLRRLDDGSDEPLGLLALCLAACLAWRDRHSLQSTRWEKTSGAIMLLVSVLGIGHLPPLIRAAIAVLGTGLWCGIHRKPGLLGLLGLSLPLIASLQFYAGYPMRLAAAWGTVKMLEIGGIMLERNGVNINLGGQLIGVDPACSGIRMLWVALAAAMALSAIHRTSWQTTLKAGLLAVALVIPANIIRATWLTVMESGRFSGINPGHTHVGLLCFVVVLTPLWIFISKRARPPHQIPHSQAPRAIDHGILAATSLLAIFALVRTPPTPIPQTHPAPSEFTFNGLTLPLEPLPASPSEQAFAAGFPGSISSHRWGNQEVILRRVTQATRMLHPSRDCLRAAGFETSNAITVRSQEGDWARFYATSDEARLTVHERIVSEQDGTTWTDVQSWYWSALWHPLNGPWRAETVISP